MPSSPVPRRRPDPSRPRGGTTLLELVVVLAILGGVVALVAPSLSAPPAPRDTFGDMLRRARGAAITRAQSLVLAVDADGRWVLQPPAPDDSTVVLEGRLAASGTVGAFVLRLTPMGGCLPVSPLPRALSPWDAARCTPAAAPSAGATGAMRATPAAP